MRKMEITEIDSNCYRISTEDFKDDRVVYHWASTPGYFYAENIKTYKRHYFDWGEFPEIGKAVAKIWKIEHSRLHGDLLGLSGIDW